MWPNPQRDDDEGREDVEKERERREDEEERCMLEWPKKTKRWSQVEKKSISYNLFSFDKNACGYESCEWGVVLWLTLFFSSTRSSFLTSCAPSYSAHSVPHFPSIHPYSMLHYPLSIIDNKDVVKIAYCNHVRLLYSDVVSHSFLRVCNGPSASDSHTKPKGRHTWYKTNCSWPPFFFPCKWDLIGWGIDFSFYYRITVRAHIYLQGNGVRRSWSSKEDEHP